MELGDLGAQVDVERLRIEQLARPTRCRAGGSRRAGSRTSRTAGAATGTPLRRHRLRPRASAGRSRPSCQKFGSVVRITSGFHRITCSNDTVASPARASAAALRAPRKSSTSTLIEPLPPRLQARRRRGRSRRGVFTLLAPRAALASFNSPSYQAASFVGVALVAHQPSERAQRRRRRLDAPVEQRVRNASSAPAPASRARRGSAPVEPTSTIRSVFALQHDLHVRGVAAPGEPAELGQLRVALGEELRLVRPHGARPADELVGRDGEHQHARRRPGGVDALDFRRRA